jgi:1-acyl-sn-glycerol-3-phosphate acyltransferase
MLPIVRQNQHCLNNAVDENKRFKCLMCNDLISYLQNDINLEKTSQIWTDVYAIKNIKKRKNLMDYCRLVSRVTRLVILAGYLKVKYIFHKPKFADAANASARIMKIFNATVTLKGLEKYDGTQQVFIFNHNHMSDPFLLGCLCTIGLPEFSTLTSIRAQSNWMTRTLSKGAKLFVIQRGKTKDTIASLKKSIDNGENIALFPQGIMTNNSIISKFRSGAFQIGAKIMPIVIKHQTETSSQQTIDFLCQKNIIVEVEILDSFDPAEHEIVTKEDIESVRIRMAEAGNFKLSRLCNRDVIES